MLLLLLLALLLTSVHLSAHTVAGGRTFNSVTTSLESLDFPRRAAHTDGDAVHLHSDVSDPESVHVPVDNSQGVYWWLQLSDTHISVNVPSRASDIHEFLVPALALIRPAAVIVSGDLTGASAATAS